MKTVKKPLSQEIYRFNFIAEQERQYWVEYGSETTTRKELIDAAALEFLSLVAALSPSRAAARKLVASVVAEFLEDVLFLRWPRKKKPSPVKQPENYKPMKFFKKEKK